MIVREFSQSQLQLALAAGGRRISRTIQNSSAGGIDSRALVAAYARHGVMRGVVSTLGNDADKLVAKARAIPKMDD